MASKDDTEDTIGSPDESLESSDDQEQSLQHSQPDDDLDLAASLEKDFTAAMNDGDDTASSMNDMNDTDDTATGSAGSLGDTAEATTEVALQSITTKKKKLKAGSFQSMSMLKCLVIPTRYQYI